MRRLRLLRLLVPAILLPFLVYLAFTIRQRPDVLSRGPLEGRVPAGPRAESIELTDIWGGDRRLFIQAGVGELDAEGRLRLQGVERLEVDRREASPLVLRAERGRVDGKPGERILRLEGGVELQDDDAGLHLLLPSLEVDEAAGVARSLGAVSFEEPRYSGHASSLLYGLRGQPTRLRDLEVVSPEGFRLTAREASLSDRGRSLALSGDVRAGRGDERFGANTIELRRDEDGRLRSGAAEGAVEGSGFVFAGAPTAFHAARAQTEWNARGTVTEVLLAGGASVAQLSRTLAADRIEGSRPEEGGHWEVTASQSVRATGMLDNGSSVLTTDSLIAYLDGSGQIGRATSEGRVRFEGTERSAEAARAELAQRTITLWSGPGRKARLALGRTRVAGKKIATDSAGDRLTADGEVEATLLRESGTGRAARGSAIFRAADTVHFVAAHLESEHGGNRLVFAGGVRAWQGERNLSAERVEIEQSRDVLRARGKVNTRLPRSEELAASAADFVQIAADALDYTGTTGTAVYTGNVRVRQAEGWLESERLEVLLGDSGGIRELRAESDVRFEFRTRPEQGMPRPVTGRGDRLVYTFLDRIVRLLGDAGPATIRREGEGEGTTTGRVLRYHLDDGSLEVGSEDN